VNTNLHPISQYQHSWTTHEGDFVVRRCFQKMTMMYFVVLWVVALHIVDLARKSLPGP